MIGGGKLMSAQNFALIDILLEHIYIRITVQNFMSTCLKFAKSYICRSYCMCVLCIYFVSPFFFFLTFNVYCVYTSFAYF